MSKPYLLFHKHQEVYNPTTGDIHRVMYFGYFDQNGEYKYDEDGMAICVAARTQGGPEHG